MGGLYKILAKVLANKLKRVVGQVVLKAHNANVEGRKILDAALIANEVVDVLLRRKKSGFLASLTLRRHMTIFLSKVCRRWVLQQSGLVGSVSLFLRRPFLSW